MDGLENEQAQAMAPEAPAKMEPVDMAQAFKMLNEAERRSAEEPVAPQVPVQQPGSADEPGGIEVGGGGDEPDVGGVPAPVDAGGSGDVGGPAVGIEAIDFDARKQAILKDIQQQAQKLVRDEFREGNIGYYSLNELRVQDESSGQVRFRNPDVDKNDTRNPDYWFKSRPDAMAFVESWNKGVDEEWRKAVNRKQIELLNDVAPRIRVLDFAKAYNAMDDLTRNVFDTLVAPYEVTDKAGKPIGYNVDLNSMAAQARSIVTAIRKEQQASQQPQQQPQQARQPQAKQQGSAPAVDMKSGNGRSADYKEPTTIGEALKIVDQRNRSK